MDAENELQDSRLAAAQQLKKEYENVLDAVWEKWERGLNAMGKTLAELQDSFNKKNELNDLFMKPYEQAYKMTGLMDEINKSINDTSQLASKQELAGLLDEINKKQLAGVQLSQYEAEAYRKQYELLLAKAALEDAQNAKSDVRMTRDANGGMSYTYTADQDAIDNAQGGYNDAAYGFAELNDNRIQALSSRVIDIYNRMQEELRAIDVNDTERRQEIMDRYTKEIDYIQQQLGVAFNWNSKINDLTIADNWRLADEFSDTVLSQVLGYDTLNEAKNAFLENTKEMLSNLDEANRDYKDKLSGLMEDTGLDMENLEQTVIDSLDKIDEGLSDTADEAESMRDDWNSALNDAMSQAKNFESTWKNVVENIVIQAQRICGALQQVIAEYRNLNSVQNGGPGNYNSGEGSGSITDPGNNPGTPPDKNPPTSPPTKPPIQPADGDKRYDYLYPGSVELYKHGL